MSCLVADLTQVELASVWSDKKGYGFDFDRRTQALQFRLKENRATQVGDEHDYRASLARAPVMRSLALSKETACGRIVSRTPTSKRS
jgi:hypothetical protein